jgi:hypothetical protein
MDNASNIRYFEYLIIFRYTNSKLQATNSLPDGEAGKSKSKHWNL